MNEKAERQTQTEDAAAVWHVPEPVLYQGTMVLYLHIDMVNTIEQDGEHKTFLTFSCRSLICN